MGTVGSDDRGEDRERMRRALVSEQLIRQMNENEGIGLDFLIDCIENTSACSITGSGTICFKIDDEIEISLDVERTVRNGIRIRKMMESHPSNGLRSPMIGVPTMERRLYVYARSNRGESRLPHPACVLSLASQDIPCTDDCASFVLSAENGDLTQIDTISRSISYAMEFARREEKDIITRVVLQELERVMSLSWNEMICEHEDYANPSDLRAVCAEEAREAVLNHDPELEWTGDPPNPEKIAQKVLSRTNEKMFEGRI